MRLVCCMYRSSASLRQQQKINNEIGTRNNSYESWNGLKYVSIEQRILTVGP